MYDVVSGYLGFTLCLLGYWMMTGDRTKWTFVGV